MHLSSMPLYSYSFCHFFFCFTTLPRRYAYLSIIHPPHLFTSILLYPLPRRYAYLSITHSPHRFTSILVSPASPIPIKVILTMKSVLSTAFGVPSKISQNETKTLMLNGNRAECNDYGIIKHVS